MECHVYTVGPFIFFAQINILLDITSQQQGPNRRCLNLRLPASLFPACCQWWFIKQVEGYYGLAPMGPLLSVHITAKWQTPAHRPPPTLIGLDRCWGIFASPCPSKSLGRCVALSVIFSSSHPLSMARGVSRLCQHQALIPRAIFDIRRVWTVVQLKHFYLLFELPGHDRHCNTDSTHVLSLGWGYILSNQ